MIADQPRNKNGAVMIAKHTKYFQPDAHARRVFIVFSTRDLPYARICIQGLLAHVVTPVMLHLIVGDADEVAQMDAALALMEIRPAHRVRTIARADIDTIAADRFAAYPYLMAFRDGHPCWRKITDPYLLSAPGDDIVILDPDLFFPNPFAFEPQPQTDILLMHQGPNCLFPPRAVRRAFDRGIAMADHVDIGVAYAPTSAYDLPWLDDLLGKLQVADFKRYMHIEAIVWAAMCMRSGGGYLDTSAWRCWQKGYLKRALMGLGVPGIRLLKQEPLADLKCLHVSGPSKYWVVTALDNGTLTYGDTLHDTATRTTPVVRFTRRKFDRLQRAKTLFYGLTGRSAAR